MFGGLYGNSVSDLKMVVILRSAMLLMAFSAVLTLTACDFGASKTPTGQVVATVGGREITRRELEVEMNGTKGLNPAAQKVAEQAALQRIIQRVVLASAARAQGLDKDPNFALLRQRADEALLVNLLETKVAASVPGPTKEEAEQFEETNPNLFVERKIFDIDQIRFFRPSDPQIVKKLEPLQTMDEIVTFLNQNHISFQRGNNTMDSLGQNPKLLGAILALRQHEVFILSSQSEIFVNEIQDVRTVPFVGEPATKFALNSLKNTHIQDAVIRQLKFILAKNAGSVRLNKEFASPKSPAKKP